MRDFSRLGPLQATDSHVHRKSGSIKEMVQDIGLHDVTTTTYGKYHMAYRFVPFPMALNDLAGHSPAAGFIRYDTIRERDAILTCARKPT